MLSQKFEEQAMQYLAHLDRGASVREALDAGLDVVHHPVIVDAATQMLVRDGTIDMKRLAGAAGMSRASLYRYYPGRQQMESELAAIAFEAILAVTIDAGEPLDRLETAASHLVANPAHAMALLAVVSASPVALITRSVEMVVGDASLTGVLVGFVTLVAAANRTGGRDDVGDVVSSAIGFLRSR